MNIRKYIELLFLLFLSPGLLKSQDIKATTDKAYGLDQTLYNGKKYNYFLPIGTKGNQYLLSAVFVNGSLTLKNKIYNDVSLNYDVFNQELLLKYRDDRGSMNIIEVSKAWIKGFRMGNMNFEYLDLEKKPRYFQVLGEGEMRMLFFWRKSFDLEGSGGSYYFAFSAPIRDSYVLMKGQLKPYSTNYNFIRIFDPEQRPELKSYLHKNKIKVKKATDQEMEQVINFISKLK
jgi:hypothetical protein